MRSALASTIVLSSRWKSGASGVVRGLGISRLPRRVTTVPISPQVRAAAEAMDSTMYATVVLPLVPVIPIRSTCSEGFPCTSAAMTGIARLVSATLIKGTRADGVR